MEDPYCINADFDRLISVHRLTQTALWGEAYCRLEKNENLIVAGNAFPNQFSADFWSV